MSVWQAAADLARGGGGGAIATVAECRGSTPVQPGTKMVVGEADRLTGTVGGGCVEADVIAAGLEVQRSGLPRLITHHLNADVAGDLGLSCGGTVEIFVEPVCRSEECVRVYE
ncbi:MAG: XdhC family protein, partial [Gemmatimonadales bacterium]